MKIFEIFDKNFNFLNKFFKKIEVFHESFVKIVFYRTKNRHFLDKNAIKRKLRVLKITKISFDILKIVISAPFPLPSVFILLFKTTWNFRLLSPRKIF